MTGRAPYLNDRLQAYTSTIFAEMSALAVRTRSINLGQGFPDGGTPVDVLDGAVEAIRAGYNQYPPGRGIPELLTAVSEHQRRWYGLSYDPDREVLVTAGATEALAASILAICNEGDEVILFEPFYDSYAACTAMAGATRRVVGLRGRDWSFDPETLRAAVTPRTKLLILNSPHNPTGKVFSSAELEAIAEVCIEADLVSVTDEVYEHLVFAGSHVPLATLPGMRDRTIAISSAGKTFSVTGWKVGWACAPAPLIDAVRTAKQFLTYVNAAPFQHAIADALGWDAARFTRAAEDLRERRDLLCAGLSDLGFEVFVPDATYFVTTDVRPLGFEDGVAFCSSLPHRCGVVAIPSSVFYDDKMVSQSLVRWTFCKPVDMLEEALTRLKQISP